MTWRRALWFVEKAGAVLLIAALTALFIWDVLSMLGDEPYIP